LTFKQRRGIDAIHINSYSSYLQVPSLINQSKAQHINSEYEENNMNYNLLASRLSDGYGIG